MKAIIPAAGLGSRLLPFTAALPKEMIMFKDKPLIHHVVDECIESGVHELVIVINENKKSIVNYFNQVLSRYNDRVVIEYCIQPEQNGLADAISCAQQFISDEYFFVALPDVIYESEKSPICSMLKNFSVNRTTFIIVEQVCVEDIDKYGIVIPEDLSDSTTGKIEQILEKPNPSQTTSRLGVVGRYILPQSIFQIIEELEPDKNNEKSITCAINHLNKSYFYKSESTHLECGTLESYLDSLNYVFSNSK